MRFKESYRDDFLESKVYLRRGEGKGGGKVNLSPSPKQKSKKRNSQYVEAESKRLREFIKDQAKAKKTYDEKFDFVPELPEISSKSKIVSKASESKIESEKKIDDSLNKSKNASISIFLQCFGDDCANFHDHAGTIP